MRPGPATRALGAIIRDLIDTRDGATYFAKRVWGVALHYDLDGSHPLTGRSVPDFELLDGRKSANSSGRAKVFCWILTSAHHLRRWQAAGPTGSPMSPATPGIGSA